MQEQQLREMLARLHEEFGGTEPLDDATRQLLRTVFSDIEQRLGGTVGAGADEASLAGRVREATLEFEGTHPRLTSALEEMALVLSRMGI